VAEQIQTRRTVAMRARMLPKPSWSWLAVAPFFALVAAFMAYPALSIITRTFVDERGQPTLANVVALNDAIVINSFVYTLQLSIVTALGGGVLGLLIAYAITVGGLPRWVRDAVSSFSGVASNFAGGLGMVYLIVPLLATLQFSFQARRGELSLLAYENILAGPEFFSSFAFSFQAALITIAISVLVLVPAAYWVQFRLPRLQPVIELLTLLPIVVPAVVLVFALIRSYNRTPLTDSREGTYILLIGSYIMLAFPFIYRAIDIGLRAINVRTLTEAAQSLGAEWYTVLARVIVPNIVVALLSGAFVTFAIVMGEFTIAALLSQPAFGPYMHRLSLRRVYEPSAVAVLSFGITWAAIAVLQLLGSRGSTNLLRR
jgi:putative spermidine/putrescine transport system permease protein